MSKSDTTPETLYSMSGSDSKGYSWTRERDGVVEFGWAQTFDEANKELFSNDS